MERVKGKSLQNINFEGDEKFAKAAMALVEGLYRFYVQTGYLHRDLHPGNIIYDESANKLYIIDWGGTQSMQAGGNVFQKVSNYKHINTFSFFGNEDEKQVLRFPFFKPDDLISNAQLNELRGLANDLGLLKDRKFTSNEERSPPVTIVIS